MGDLQKSMPSMLVRTAQQADGEVVSSLVIQSVNHFHGQSFSKKALEIWRREYNPTRVQEQIQTRYCLVLEVEKELVGFIQFDESDAEIKGFYLKPSASGKGYGRMLLLHLLDDLKGKGHKEVSLTSNSLVVPFYEKMGFQNKGIELVYLEGHPYPEARMVIALQE